MATLDLILQDTTMLLETLRSEGPALERAAAAVTPRYDFRVAVERQQVAVIAEVKRRSPSLGIINGALDPVALASSYQQGGAAAISVLTNEAFFGGSLADLHAVASAVPAPVIRKDFLLDELQLLEARAAGASAVLLIVRILTQPRLEQMLQAARELDLGVLVEAHTPDEVRRAVDAGAGIIGVNARDLDTLVIDTAAGWNMLALVPTHCVAVAESGMASLEDVVVAATAGADAVLIGSALARSANPERDVRMMSGVARRGR